jgi:hypothetical protein
LKRKYHKENINNPTPENAALAGLSRDDIIKSLPEADRYLTAQDTDSILVDSKQVAFTLSFPSQSKALSDSKMAFTIKHFNGEALEFNKKNNGEITAVIGLNKYGQKVRFSKNTFGRGYTKDYLDEGGKVLARSKKNNIFANVEHSKSEKEKICKDLIMKFNGCKNIMNSSSSLVTEDKKNKASKVLVLIVEKIAKIAQKDPNDVMIVLSRKDTLDSAQVMRDIKALNKFEQPVVTPLQGFTNTQR